MRISDGSSDVCSSDLRMAGNFPTNSSQTEESMHRSRLGGVIIDCQTEDLDGEAAFWGRALGLPTRPSESPEGMNYVRFRTEEGRGGKEGVRKLGLTWLRFR